MSKRKIYVVGASTGYANWLEGELVNDMGKADIVLFTGGCDVDPSFYNRENVASSYHTDRDVFEKAEYERAISLKVPLLLGVCRGFQFINVMNGGILAQDISNHAIGRTHGMTNGKEMYEINSLHHQMVYPFNISPDKYKILYWADPMRSHHYLGLTDEEIKLITCEPEVAVYYTNENTKCLGIQGHPEMLYWRDMYHPTIDMLNNLVNKYLYDK